MVQVAEMAQVRAHMAQVSFWPTYQRRESASYGLQWRRCAHFFRTCAICRSHLQRFIIWQIWASIREAGVEIGAAGAYTEGMDFVLGRFYRHNVDAEGFPVIEEGVHLSGNHHVRTHPAVSL